MHIQAPCVVSLAWRLEDAHGHLIDEHIDPDEFFYGADDLFAKVEEVLLEQGEGFEVTLHLEPEHAFGEYHAELVCFEARSLFPEALVAGLQFEGLPDGAQTPDMPADVIYTATEVYDSHVVLDGNHPLAGMALVLQLKVRSVREASEDEIAQSGLDSGGSLFQIGGASPSVGMHAHAAHALLGDFDADDDEDDDDDLADPAQPILH
ncbi:MAG: peptidylprolyl isomerase [Leptothrix sp. (in: b-proteobacteria)]